MLAADFDAEAFLGRYTYRRRPQARDAGSGAISLEDAVVTAKAEHDLEPERKPASIEWTYEQVSDSPMSGGGRQMVVVGTRGVRVHRAEGLDASTVYHAAFDAALGV